MGLDLSAISEHISSDWSTGVHPPKGVVAPTAQIYKYWFYFESSTQEDMEIKCFKKFRQPVAKKKKNILKMSKCT